jgi:hypothetical protein
MKQIPSLIALMLVASLSACSRSSSSSSEGPLAPDASVAAMKQTPSWQLQDASTFSATIEPWPPREGVATLKADEGVGANGKFTGSVEYRLAAAAQTSETWQPLPKASEDQNETVHFAAPITLNKGTVFIQFRVRTGLAKDFTALSDWNITVK